MFTGTGIKAVATFPGEVELSIGELANVCGTTERAIHRSMAGRRMQITRSPPIFLAREAAVICLQQASCDPRDIDAIIYLGDQASGLRFQEEIGAKNAFILAIAGDCSETLSALALAQSLASTGTRQTLIASGEQFARRHTDTVPTEQNYRNLLGDAGSALLTGDSKNLQFLGFGFASLGAQWSYLTALDTSMKEPSLPKELPFFGQIFRDLVPTAQVCLERCLKHSGLNLNDVDHFCFSSIRLRPLLLPLLRILGIPQEKLSSHPTYVHMGQADVAFDIQNLLAESRAKAGQIALIMASGTGIFRCMAFRL